MKISSGYLFGEMEVLEFSTRLAFAVCTELTKLLICKADVFLKSLDTYPDILVEVVTFNRCEVDEIHKNRKQFFLEKRIEIKSSARITKLPMRTLHMVTRGSASRQIQSCKEFSRWKIEEIVDSKFSRRMKRLQVTPVNSMLTAKRILRKQAT
jgi:CRP-like cAMP-binding protein